MTLEQFHVKISLVLYCDTELSKEVAELRRQVAKRSLELSGEVATEAVAVVEALRSEKDAALQELSTLQSTMKTLQQVWHWL